MKQETRISGWKGLVVIVGLLLVIVVVFQAMRVQNLNRERLDATTAYSALVEEQEILTESIEQLNQEIEALDQETWILGMENTALRSESEATKQFLTSQVRLMQRDDYDFLLNLYDLGLNPVQRQLKGFVPGFAGEENLEMNLELIAYYLSTHLFNGLPVEFGGLETVEGKTVAIIHLNEDERNEKSWNGQYFQGTLGAHETETRLIESFLQPELDLDPWIDGVRFVYEEGEDFVGHVETLMSGTIWRSPEAPVEVETLEVLPVFDGERVIYRSETTGLQMTADRSYADNGLKVRVGIFNRLVIYYEFPNGEWFDFGAYILDDNKEIIYDRTLDVGFQDTENFIYYHALKRHPVQEYYSIEVVLIDPE